MLHARLAGLLAALALCATATADRFKLPDGARVVVTGNTFAERMALSGYFDALAYASHSGNPLIIRHVPWSADEVAMSPRETKVPTTDDRLEEYQANVIVMCFGMSESFGGADGLGDFETNLAALIEKHRTAGYSAAAPQMILVSPIAHEDLGAPMLTGADVETRNATIATYVDVMRRVAETKGVRFVDLFRASPDLYAASREPLTNNGIHPNELGCFHFVRAMGEQLGWMEGNENGTGDADALRALAYDKHYHQRLVYRPTNTEYVWGRRHEPYGIVNFPPEWEQLGRMMDARDRALQTMAHPSPTALFATAPSGAAVWENVPSSSDFPEDSWSPPPVEAKGRENSLGDTNIKSPDDFVASFTLPEGYAIECFASEETIPELQNPLAMTFDAHGRLWVLCTPTYPHLMPGEKPHCRLIIISDTDGDGTGDDCTVFVDDLYCATGFAVDTDAVYIGQAPDLWKFTDTDGDDVADRREIVASGFGMCDSHHQVSAFEWDPNGGIVIHEGVFTKSNVETPYGTMRIRDAATWRYEPRTQRLYVMSHTGHSNPWGHAYDDYGQSVLADASGGDNFSFSHLIMPYDFPRKPKRIGPFINRGRPTAGCELISSRHFPEDVQDSFLVNQSIGFHGTRWCSTEVSGSGWSAAAMPKDLVDCSDTNFRPVAMEIGPDGALYIVDWCNPIIGHMQYNVRDPRRDHMHGRVWRVRHVERDFVDPPAIADTAPELLAQLRIPERNTRQHARRRLQTMEPKDVFPDLTSWVASLDPADPLHDRMLLESLWIHQAHGRLDLDLLDRVATANEPRARAGAVRVLRHWLQQGVVSDNDGLTRLERAASDDDMRVRLEAAVAAGFVRDVAGAAVAGLAASMEMDEAMRISVQETLVHLEKYGEPQSDIVRRLRLERMPATKLAAQPIDELAANVMIRRPDVSVTDRSRALATISTDGPQPRIQFLLDQLATATTTDAIDALGGLLLDENDANLAAAQQTLRMAHTVVPAHARTYTLAAMVRAAPATYASALEENPSIAVRVLPLLEPNEALHPAALGLRDAVERGLVAPSPATELAALYGPDTDLFAWLAAQIDRADERGMESFGGAHASAMAALRTLNSMTNVQWPDGYERYRVDAVSSARYTAGRAIYHDEVVGCVRCHGPNGRGEEGFPPLDRSAWVLGNPQRAASIVVHGLYGRLELHDGRVFDAVMDPLGANLSDEQIADVLSYVRQSWGNYAPAVDVEDVRIARAVKDEDGSPLFTEAVVAQYPLANDGIVAPVARQVTMRESFISPMILILCGVASLLVVVVVVGIVKLSRPTQAHA